MNIFLSYAGEDVKIAAEIEAALSSQGYDVFFDRTKLKSGKEYDATIYDNVQASDRFVFLISPGSVAEGSYARTELKFAKDKWKTASGNVLPVMVVTTSLDDVDPYLRTVTILFPEGNVAAEVVAAVRQLDDPESSGPGRGTADADLQRERIHAYKVLWRLTGLLPKWPRSESVSYDDLRDLTKSFRDWYFDEGGGMFMSRPASTAYAALQNELTALLADHPAGLISDAHYDAIRERCSTLRTELAADIGARGC